MSALFVYACCLCSAQQQEWETTRSAERERNHWSRIALAKEPLGSTASLALLDRYIEAYAANSVYDPIISLYRVQALAAGDNQVTLGGEVSLSWYKSGTEQMFRALGFDVAENTIRVLPDERLGRDRYAVSTTSAATMRKSPTLRSEQVNSVVWGWPMRLLREAAAEDLLTSAPFRRQGEDDGQTYSGRWWLAQSSDGYIGFVRADQIRRTNRYHLPDAVLSKPAFDQATTIPAGAAVYVDPRGHYVIPSPSGVAALKVSTKNLVRLENDMTSATILQAAKPVFGTRYLWGGVTEGGIDCSGFTNFVYKTQGIFLPRDARPQSVVGQIVAWGSDVEKEAKAGDLVFFADESGRISHIGLSLGDGKLIHSSGGLGVHVCGYDEVSNSRPNGMLERVIFARRVLGKAR